MALSDRSLLLYGIQVTEFNSSIDFKADALDVSPRQATLNIGFYSAAGLAREIVRALSELDALNTYTVTVDRTIAGGTQNRITISTSGTFLEFYFLTGPRTASTAATLMGFNVLDYTGSTTYTGSFSVGTPLIPTLKGYTYLGPEFDRKVFGSVNISASGVKEAIVFNIQKFIQVEYKYEPKAFVVSDWFPFMEWAIQQRPFDFTPEISSPTVFYECTLEKTQEDGKGLGYKFMEMLPKFANFYQTGLLTMRQRND